MDKGVDNYFSFLTVRMLEIMNLFSTIERTQAHIYNNDS